MSKFIINEGHEISERAVEADNYEEKAGYFHFYDGDGQVLTIAANQVSTITRKSN